MSGAAEIVYDETKEPVEKHPYERLPDSFWCRIGWHTYEREPGLQFFLRSTGLNVLFATSGVQVGIRRCRCCDKRKFVYRTGWFGMGGSATRWKGCSEFKANRINSRRVGF